MQRILIIILIAAPFFMTAQTEKALLSHYQDYYQAMRSQGDVRGVINALTHLNVLDPKPGRIDTLAYVYANNNQHMQALNTIGIEKDTTASDLAVQVKAVSLKAMNQPERAKEQFMILYNRQANPYLAYEIADLMIQVGEDKQAMEYITYGLANATDDMTYAFYERQQPYEASLKAAFVHLKGLVQYNTNKEDVDTAIATMDEALAIDPNFNLASLSKQALISRKAQQEPKE